MSWARLTTDELRTRTAAPRTRLGHPTVEVDMTTAVDDHGRPWGVVYDTGRGQLFARRADQFGRPNAEVIVVGVFTSVQAAMLALGDQVRSPQPMSIADLEVAGTRGISPGVDLVTLGIDLDLFDGPALKSDGFKAVEG
jgi:hypothetical protein